MNKRERNMLLITLAIVVPLFAYAFLSSEDDEGSSGGGGGAASLVSADLGQATRQFRDMDSVLKQRETIEQNYARITFNKPENSPGRTVGETFQIEISRLLTSIFKIENPSVSPPRATEIENVSDYCLVSVTISVSGTHDEIVQLLRNLHAQGLLIKSYTLNRPGGWRGNDRVNLSVEVSRLVQPDVQTRAQLFGAS